MSGTLAAALGSAAGALFLIWIVVILVWYCFLRNRRISRTSETNSSDPSLPVGQNVELSLSEGVSYAMELNGARCFPLEELNVATKNFSDVTLIGHGTFGEVNKGLLQNGTIVAIKRRSSAPTQEFIEEVCYLSSIRHRNLVSLLGYCQESDMQMLIYEYIPNGSVSAHLFGSIQASSGKLEFKHRLSIANGAAKGLVHLHSQTPPLVHTSFRTVNVLVDEGFTPKVSDAGIRRLLRGVDNFASSSRMVADDPFLDANVKESGEFSVKSDVYSFGVFLLELASGREAIRDKRIIQLAQNYYKVGSDISSLVDTKMGNSFTLEGMKELFRLIMWCLNSSSEDRPTMQFVESELHRIHEKEMSLTTVMGEGTTTVTLGSQLFTTSVEVGVCKKGTSIIN